MKTSVYRHSLLLAVRDSYNSLGVYSMTDNDPNIRLNEASMKQLDRELAERATGERIKWSLIFLSDGVTQAYNDLQTAILGKYNRSLSRLLTAVTFAFVWLLPVIIFALW